ncbi:MAG TPA: hypothetical protein VNS09_12410 [Solirubrobacter sp.]|nr:hypothetical protein [Solirubrobacter sp.]
MKRLLLIPAAVLAVGAGVAAAAPAEAPPVLERSAALTTAAPPSGAATIPAAEARAAADRLARSIPLPEGGTFAGVRWEEAGGHFAPADISAVLQYNAFCQWMRSWRDGRDAALSAAVLADVPAWSAWRGAEAADRLTEVVADVRAGGGTAATETLADCDASHAREVEYAAAHGLTPSR